MTTESATTVDGFGPSASTRLSGGADDVDDVDVAEGTAGTGDTAPRASRGRALLATALAVASGAACYYVVDLGIASGAVGLLLLLAVLVLVPSDRLLVRRLALNIAVGLGWTPVLWWVDWPVRVDHAGVVVGAGMALVVLLYLRASDPRALLPVVRRTDALLVGTAVATTWATQRWLFARDPQDALVQLLPGADNWAHFNMFVGLRTYGATPEAISSAPDGSGWAFANYPKGFHALVATLSEVLDPSLTSGARALPVYAHSVGLLLVLGVLLVTASVLSLRGLGSRPAVCLPVLALTCTGLLWEPGQKVIGNGFANFWIAAVAAGCALLVAVRSRRPRIVDVVAVTGLVMLVCHTWTPLVVLALPAAVLVLLPFVATVGHRSRLVALAVVLLGAAGGLKAVVTLMATVPVGFIVSEVSGFDGTSPLPTFALTIAGIYVLIALRSVVRRTGSDLAMSRGQALVLLATPLIGVLTLTVLLVAQVRTIGTTSYYFLKFLLGYELVLVVLVPALIALLVVALLPEARPRRWSWPLSVALAVVGTQAFGPLTVSAALLFDQGDDGTAAIEAPDSRPAMARGIVAAVATTSPGASFHREYLPLGEGNATQIFYPDAWFHAVNASTSDTVTARLAVLRHDVRSADEAAPLVAQMLRSDPRLVVLVPADQLSGLVAALDDPTEASRLRPVPTPAP